MHGIASIFEGLRRMVRKGLAILLLLAGCDGGEDPDLAGAGRVAYGDSVIAQASANSNNGQSLRPPRYLPAWGSYFPDSLVGSKLVQRWPDGRSGRSTKMVAFVPVEQVVTFYREAIAAAGLPAEPGPWQRGARWELGGGNGYQSNAVLVSDQSWKNGDGSTRYKVEITVIEALPLGWKKP
jgi:hypothetical protein